MMVLNQGDFGLPRPLMSGKHLKTFLVVTPGVGGTGI